MRSQEDNCLCTGPLLVDNEEDSEQQTPTVCENVLHPNSSENLYIQHIPNHYDDN